MYLHASRWEGQSVPPSSLQGKQNVTCVAPEPRDVQRPFSRSQEMLKPKSRNQFLPLRFGRFGATRWPRERVAAQRAHVSTQSLQAALAGHPGRKRQEAFRPRLGGAPVKSHQHGVRAVQPFISNGHCWNRAGAPKMILLFRPPTPPLPLRAARLPSNSRTAPEGGLSRSSGTKRNPDVPTQMA